MLLHITQGVTERTEQNDLIVFLMALVFNNFQKSIQLFIRLRQIFRQFDYSFCHCTEFSFQLSHLDVFKITDRNIAIFTAVVGKNISQSPGHHTLQQRCQTKDAAGCLPHKSAHHKFQRHIIMQIAECMGFKLHQRIIQFLLLRCKMDRNTLRTAYTEIILDVLTACTVDHSSKAMQTLHILKDSHTVCPTK